MTRLRSAIVRVRMAVTLPDVLAGVGIACIAFGAWLAWPPAGWLVLGTLLILIARSEAV